MTKYWKWTVAGLTGSSIGVAIWVAVTHGTGYEVGWIAWGVGVLAGIGVKIGAGGEEGPAQGMTAGAVAVVAILAAKYIVAVLMVGSIPGLADVEIEVTPEMAIASIAQEIVAEQEEAGKEPEWPEVDVDDEDVPVGETFPPGVWDEAKTRWDALSPEEQQAKIKEEQELADEFMSTARSAINEYAFKESFSPMDALWFILAAVSAYKIGAGSDD